MPTVFVIPNYGILKRILNPIGFKLLDFQILKFVKSKIFRSGNLWIFESTNFETLEISNLHIFSCNVERPGSRVFLFILTNFTNFCLFFRSRGVSTRSGNRMVSIFSTCNKREKEDRR